MIPRETYQIESFSDGTKYSVDDSISNIQRDLAIEFRKIRNNKDIFLNLCRTLPKQQNSNQNFRDYSLQNQSQIIANPIMHKAFSSSICPYEPKPLKDVSNKRTSYSFVINSMTGKSYRIYFFTPNDKKEFTSIVHNYETKHDNPIIDKMMMDLMNNCENFAFLDLGR